MILTIKVLKGQYNMQSNYEKNIGKKWEIIIMKNMNL